MYYKKQRDLYFSYLLPPHTQKYLNIQPESTIAASIPTYLNTPTN